MIQGEGTYIYIHVPGGFHPTWSTNINFDRPQVFTSLPFQWSNDFPVCMFTRPCSLSAKNHIKHRVE